MRIINPYHNLRHDWLQGQLHVHTDRSDGKLPFSEMVDQYALREYDFLAVTDHDTAPDSDDIASYGHDMVLIPGQEYRCRNNSEIGMVGTPQTLETKLAPREAVRRADAVGAFTAMNHPSWHICHWQVEQMIDLEGIHGVEVYNALIESLPGPADSAHVWDLLLSCGLRVFGTATDDAHSAEDVGKAWVMVNTEPTPEHIIAALRTGRFYASSGVQVEEIWLTDDELMVQSLDAQEIRFIADRGTVRHICPGPVGHYRVCEEDLYVRVEVFGRGSAKAWLQPVFVDSEKARQNAHAFRVWYLFERARRKGQ